MASGVGDDGAVGTQQERQQQQLHTPQPSPLTSGAFLHGTGSDGERPGYASAQEEVTMDAATRADLLEIAERSPHRHERRNWLRRVHDVNTFQHACSHEDNRQSHDDQCGLPTGCRSTLRLTPMMKNNNLPNSNNKSTIFRCKSTKRR